MTTAELTDGEIFYHIRNGIRNTGMPAWDMPDDQVWQLVAYIRHLPEVARSWSQAARQTPAGRRRAHYVGSAAAASATRMSTPAGAKRGWPMSCAIPRSIPTRSFPISRSPIRW